MHEKKTCHHKGKKALAEPDDLCCGGAHDLALAFKALSHPIRLKILKNLAAKERRCCGDICSGLPLAQSTVSQHLKVLREAGIIEQQAAGQQSHYRLNSEKLEWLNQLSNEFFSELNDTAPNLVQRR